MKLGTCDMFASIVGLVNSDIDLFLLGAGQPQATEHRLPKT